MEADGMDYNVMQKLMSNPAILQAAQNPALMQKLQALMTGFFPCELLALTTILDPNKLSEYSADPEFMQLLQALQLAMK
jgi:hypothetical protein